MRRRAGFLGCLVLAGTLASVAARAEAQEDDAPPGSEPAGAPEGPEVADPPDENDENDEDRPPVPRLIPPRLLRSEPPEYPPHRMSAGLHPTVVVQVTLDAGGTVVDAHVEHSAGPDFDRSAVEAVRRWTFAPAERNGRPVPSRIRVAVHFELPSFDLATTVPGEPTEPTSSAGHDEHAHGEEAREPRDEERGETPTAIDRATGSDGGRREEAEEEEAPAELGVTADVRAAPLRDEDRSAGDFEVERDVLAAAPTADGGDLLQRAPGAFVARAEGDAVGHRIVLRGFDAEHGQDLELRVGGLPVNLPSHIHGQGYADLGFLIPEVVQRMRVAEGVYDPNQGDFAVAGSIEFDLGVSEQARGWRLKTGYGSFHSFRQLVLWAPEGERQESFGAVQYRHTEGFGQNRRGDSVSAIVSAGLSSGDWRLRALGIVYGARAGLAGVLRADDLRAGRVDFYDSYPFPTAQSQSALTGRILLGLFGDYRGTHGDNGGLSLWAGLDTFRVQENFTGFVQRSRMLSAVAGRGDLIEQQNETISVGLTGRYRTRSWQPWEWLDARLELGLDGRLDLIDQAQNLLDAAVRNQTWDRRVDASVTDANVGLFGDLGLRLTDFVRVRAGLRSNILFFDVDDRLGNFAPVVRPSDAFIMGFRRTSAGVAVGPRVSAEVRPLKWMSIRAAYGEGFRSPQARTLEDGEEAPFTKVRSADFGVRFDWDRALTITAAGYWTQLSDDVAFEPREGRLTRIGASRRAGAVLHAEARPWEWLVGALSVTYVNAELLEPPPPTAHDPQPAFERGQNLPYVPPVLIRADVGARGTLVDDFLDDRLRGRVGLGYSFLSPRPLPFGGFADPVHLVDASAALGWGPLELGVSLFNLFDVRYAATEFLFSSNWDPAGIPARVPERHIAAGAPLTLMVTLEVAP